MPIVIPEFVQFQGVLFPLRGLWNASPPEGDRFVNAEIDWGSPGLFGVSCVQFQLSGNSPVAFSQIVAMSVDNSRCGSDVDFIYPDSGFVLTVPAFNQGIYPVFTNALMFYANSPNATLGDITIVQILNSQPPPVAIQPTSEQESATFQDINLANNGSTQLVGAGISGTLDGFSLNTSIATGSAGIQLIDGTGKVLWSGFATEPAGTISSPAGFRVRFTNGISFIVAASTATGFVTANLYYSVP